MLHACQAHGRPSFEARRASFRDAADPTGTGPLRRRFMRESDKRWRSAMRIVAEAVGRQDILGLGGASMASIGLGAATAGALSPIHHPPLPHADKVAGFAHWLGSVLDDVVLGRDGSWMAPLVGEAGNLGRRQAMYNLKHSLEKKDSLESSTKFLNHYNSLAVSELRGVFAHAVQRGTRAAATAFASRLRPAAAARGIDQALRAGMARSRLMADYIVSKAFTAATVEAYRAAGIGRVGIVPEIIRRHLVGDAVGGNVAAETDVVNVQTAGDDRVCPECEAIAAAGPYSLDEALSLIPAHPACRCTIVPSEDALAAPLDLGALGKGLAGLFAAPHAGPEIEAATNAAMAPALGPVEQWLGEIEATGVPETPEETAGVPEAPAGPTIPGWLATAALGLGAGVAGLLLAGGRRQEAEPEPVEGAAVAVPEAAAEFPETFTGRTAADYAAYLKRMMAWAVANAWPADELEGQWEAEASTRARVGMTAAQEGDLAGRLDEAMALLE